MNALIQQLQDFYRDFGDYSSEELKRLYHPSVAFTDPVHTIHGVQALDDYLRKGLANVMECRFEYQEPLVTGGRAALPWTMTYRHPNLNNAEAIRLPGISWIEFDTQVLTQQDFYDLGTMVYEQVPLLGHVVRAVKRRMQV